MKKLLVILVNDFFQLVCVGIRSQFK